MQLLVQTNYDGAGDGCLVQFNSTESGRTDIMTIKAGMYRFFEGKKKGHEMSTSWCYEVELSHQKKQNPRECPTPGPKEIDLCHR